MSRASALFRLQRLDTDLTKRQTQLADVNAKLANDPIVKQAQAALAAAHTRTEQLRQQAKTLDLENQSLADKLREVESRMYGGRVQNPRELQDLQADSQSLRRRRDALDEEQLAAMEQVEAAEKAEADAREALVAAETARAEEQRDLLAVKQSLEADIANLLEGRELAARSVQPDDLAAYDSLRKRKRGLAVAPLDNGVCGACGVAPSSSRIQAARLGDSGELVRCGNCERILYAEQGGSYGEISNRDDETITRW